MVQRRADSPRRRQARITTQRVRPPVKARRYRLALAVGVTVLILLAGFLSGSGCAATSGQATAVLDVGPPAPGKAPVSPLAGYQVTAPPASAPASVPVGKTPGRPTYDPKNGYLYVPNSGGANVTVVNGTPSWAR